MKNTINPLFKEDINIFTEWLYKKFIALDNQNLDGLTLEYYQLDYLDSFNNQEDPFRVKLNIYYHEKELDIVNKDEEWMNRINQGGCKYYYINGIIEEWGKCHRTDTGERNGGNYTITSSDYPNIKVHAYNVHGWKAWLCRTIYMVPCAGCLNNDCKYASYSKKFGLKRSR